MPGISMILKFRGGEKLLKSLTSKDTINDPLNSGIKKITIYYERLVKKLTPVISARLRSSITHDFSGGEAKVGTNVHYASSVEYGKGGMQPRHVMGGSTRIKGKGPFTRGLELLQVWLKKGDHNIHKGIEGKFG